MRPCHVIPSKISAHVAFVSVIRLSDVSKRFDGRAYRETRTEPLVHAAALRWLYDRRTLKEAQQDL